MIFKSFPLETTLIDGITHRVQKFEQGHCSDIFLFFLFQFIRIVLNRLELFLNEAEILENLLSYTSITFLLFIVSMKLNLILFKFLFSMFYTIFNLL